MCRLILVCCASSLFLLADAARAQQDLELLDFSTDRRLSPTELDVLSKIVDQNSIGETIRRLGDTAPSVEQVCGTKFCMDKVFSELELAGEAAAKINDRNIAPPSVKDLYGWTGNVIIPGDYTGAQTDFLVADVAPHSRTPDFRAIPLSEVGGYSNLTADGPTAIISPKSPPIQLIDSDLVRLGQSRRTFALRPDAAPNEVSAALALFRAGGLAADVLAESDDQPASMISPVNVVSFDGSEALGASCETDAGGKPWPFDPVPVIEILKDNLRILAELNLALRRSVVVVADTGVGERAVAKNNGPLWPMLSPNPPELLNPSVTFKSDNGLPGSTNCVDYDNNSYFGDIFGAAGSELNNQSQCAVQAQRVGFDDRLSPVAKREQAIETYEPSHGSFVATLSVGGTSLITDYPEIQRQIGLRFFRTTRPTEPNSTKSVRVEPSDVTGAIKYALSQNAAVLNMSMKTTDENLVGLFGDLVEKSNTLVVASAGNKAEDLDHQDNGVYPAGLINDKLLVVGGLENDAEHSWWPDSATGEMHVEIAAPAVSVRSLNQDGNPVCYTGTSAAAPIVSFTAATLLSYGVFDARSAKSRILGASTFDRIEDPTKSLKGHVRNAKKLDVAAALDVFSDRISQPTGVLRGRIILPADVRLMKICASDSPALAAASGRMDPAKLMSWTRFGGDAVFELTNSNGNLGRCAIPQGEDISFQPLGETEPVSITLDTVDGIVFSAFRSIDVEKAVLKRED